MTKPDAQQQICPLCGADNQCAMAAGQPTESCWCLNVSLSPGALAAIPAESVGVRCLCPACGRLDAPAAGKVRPQPIK
ncbi:MAG: hypothetical protein DRR04_06240 [Gammaproteobacteria bacterium]|nr:MAG: hypothetical protein DRQ97_02695 [Gammaproteobacteria bacterium]RLA60232.1 MAG: hypothetical protein DRR04_06240 [Gammaproteobacteria bacterium]